MIKSIHSAAITVRDQDQALDFYVDKLGFQKLSDDEYAPGLRWIVVAPPGAQTGLALNSPQATGENPEAIGTYSGISLITDDLNATYEELRARGVAFTGAPERMPWGAPATWFTDPDGNRFFLTEG